MKHSNIKLIGLLFSSFLFITQLAAQEKFSVPQITPEQKQEILYNHVMGYATTGIGFAKTKGATPEEFGKYIGAQFTSFWDPASGFSAFANGMIFILAGMHPDNEMQIVAQNEKMVQFKLKNVDISFKNGPMFGVTYDEMLDCSEGIISVLANHMNTSFSHKIVDGIWYEVTLKAR